MTRNRKLNYQSWSVIRLIGYSTDNLLIGPKRKVESSVEARVVHNVEKYYHAKDVNSTHTTYNTRSEHTDVTHDHQNFTQSVRIAHIYTVRFLSFCERQSHESRITDSFAIRFLEIQNSDWLKQQVSRETSLTIDKESQIIIGSDKILISAGDMKLLTCTCAHDWLTLDLHLSMTSWAILLSQCGIHYYMIATLMKSRRIF